METGTGKTYVYLRTIFELHKAYGMRKFIIVVPSVAIREGVYKSLQITSEYFKALYTETPEHYVYKSEQPGDIRAFATGTNIQIMVINIDAFRKGFDAKTGAAETAEESKEGNAYPPTSEKLNGLKAIEFIRQTNPVLIIDEPQNMETANAKGALASMNPLFTLRYSATHKDRWQSISSIPSMLREQAGEADRGGRDQRSRGAQHAPHQIAQSRQALSQGNHRRDRIRSARCQRFRHPHEEENQERRRHRRIVQRPRNLQRLSRGRDQPS